MFDKKHLELLKMAVENEVVAIQKMYKDNHPELVGQLEEEQELFKQICDQLKLPAGQSWVAMDADTQGHYLSVLAEYHTFILDQWHTGEGITNDEVADTLYLLGNIEGRLLHGFVTEDDMDIIEDWEEDVEANTSRTIKITLLNHLAEEEISDLMETISSDLDSLGYTLSITEEK